MSLQSSSMAAQQQHCGNNKHVTVVGAGGGLRDGVGNFNCIQLDDMVFRGQRSVLTTSLARTKRDDVASNSIVDLHTGEKGIRGFSPRIFTHI